MLIFTVALLAGTSAAFAVVVFFAALSDLLLRLPAMRADGAPTMQTSFEPGA